MLQFVVHPPVETEAEQFATTMSDHYLRSAAEASNGGYVSSRQMVNN